MYDGWSDVPPVGRSDDSATGAVEQSVWDVVIVGAGPAGLFCALQLLAAGRRRILLLDRGPAASERRRPARGTDARGSYESGVGGAGLFSDGKLCLSLDVGGHLESSLGADHRASLLRDIAAAFNELLDPVPDAPRRPAGLDGLVRRASRSGLRFKYYPVQHIGTDRCGDVIRALTTVLYAGGARVESDTALRSVTVEPRTGLKHMTIERAGRRAEVRAHNLVLAMGKVGAREQGELCESLDIPVERQSVYLGVRFEADAGAVAPLFGGTKDPKYNLAFADGSKIKTHCASMGGEVLELRYDGLPLAGGHNYFGSRSGRSGFSLLWNGATEVGDPYRFAQRLMARTARRTEGRLMVQSVADYLDGRPSSPESMAGYRLTNRAAVPGDVRSVLPAEYLWRCDEFLSRLRGIAPALTDGRAVFYAPAIEWWMPRSRIASRFMETNRPGVYVCGDGSGWSQGIVHAAATGLLAGQGIAGRAGSVAGWMSAVAARRTGAAA